MFKLKLLPLRTQSGFSAVGSALRSGRRGRWFESSNSDKLDFIVGLFLCLWFFCQSFYLRICYIYEYEFGYDCGSCPASFASVALHLQARHKARADVADG